MQIKSPISNPMILAGGLLLLLSGYWFITDTKSTSNSPLEISFVEPDMLQNLASLSTNRLSIQIHNPTSTVARVVGNNAC